MCDPVSMLVGAVGAQAIGGLIGGGGGGSSAPAATATDPAVERAKVEAEAAQKANAKLANDQRRRREQQSLLAKGGSTFTMGDSGALDSLGNSLGYIAGRIKQTRGTLLSSGSATAGGGGGLVTAGGGGTRPGRISWAIS